jgi:hypothetical protein
MTKEVVIPWELKYKFVRGMLTTLFKGFMYLIREKFGAATALEIHEQINKMDDRIQNMTDTLRNVFNIEGNDAEAITKWYDIFNELIGIEYSVLERSKTIARRRIIKCPWATEPKDISDWCFNLQRIIYNSINPKAIIERPIAMCSGDPYCEFITRLEE